jgi:vacuolar-type H+-ATPase subunit H
MSESAPTAPDTSLQPIERVRAVEKEWETALGRFHASAKSELERLRAEVDAAIDAARTEAERARTALLEKSRTESENEAKQILAEGRERASQFAGKSAAELAALKEKLQSAVLGAFRPGSP